MNKNIKNIYVGISNKIVEDGSNKGILVEVLDKLSEVDSIEKMQLANELQITERQLRNVVRLLRRKGVPVISSSRNSGYSLAKNEQEIRGLIAEYRHRANDMICTADELEDTIKMKGLYYDEYSDID